MSKLRAAVLHVNTTGVEGWGITYRIARFVAQHFKIPIAHDVASAQKLLTNPIDVLFVKHGVLRFSEHRSEALELYGRAQQVVDLQNDYSMVVDGRFAQLHSSPIVWSTVPEIASKMNGCYVNWNAVVYEDGKASAGLFERSNAPVLGYYGAFRPDRVRYFEKYFTSSLYDVQVSTNHRNRQAFTALNVKIKIVPPFKSYDQLATMPANLYIEDVQSHTLYCSPASRFYECLRARVPMLFDVAALDTLKQAGFADAIDFAVDGPTNAKKLLLRSVQIAGEQSQRWRRDYVGEVTTQLDVARIKTFGAKSKLIPV